MNFTNNKSICFPQDKHVFLSECMLPPTKSSFYSKTNNNTGNWNKISSNFDFSIKTLCFSHRKLCVTKKLLFYNSFSTFDIEFIYGGRCWCNYMHQIKYCHIKSFYFRCISVARVSCSLGSDFSAIIKEWKPQMCDFITHISNRIK